MKRDIDPVDDVLGRLKACTWTGDPHNNKLEERLMNEFANTPASRPRPRYVSWMIALAALSVGGGAFAYAGGFKFIESLFVTVDVNGEAVQLELKPVDGNAYEGTMQTQLEGGKQADIHVRHEEAGPGEKRTEVQVNVGGDGSGEEEVAKLVVERAQGDHRAKSDVSVEVLGDAEPVKTWVSDQGGEKSLFIIPDQATGLRNIYTMQMDTNDLIKFQRVGTVPGAVGDAVPIVQVNDGTITLQWDVGEGEKKGKAVIKIRDQVSDQPIENAPIGKLKIMTRDGKEFEIGVPLPKPRE